MIATPFAAVLLAGGKSRRMGRDKAMLPLPDGRLLWQRQLAVLQELVPVEMFISGPYRDGFPADVPLLNDECSGLGPLSGMVAAFETMKVPLLVVLAIDLPAMRSGFLRRLLESSRERQGIVPRHQEPAGFYEPLAAVYPRECLHAAKERLQRRELALQGFIQAAGPLLQPHRINDAERSLFANWNEPEMAASL